MKNLKTSVFVLAILFCITSSAHALPTIYTVVMDASGSVGDSDFRKANQAPKALLKMLYDASQLPINLGRPADFISIGWFGGNDDFAQLPYINVSDITKAAVISGALERIKHPKYGYTAIYTALLKATSSAIDQEKALNGNYNQVIIVVTDGKDTQSPLEVKALTRRIFPNDKIFVSIVGVGPSADISEFEFADDRRNIADFDELKVVFGLISGFFR